MALSFLTGPTSWDEISAPSTTITPGAASTVLVVTIGTETIGDITNTIETVTSDQEGRGFIKAKGSVETGSGNENRAEIWFLEGPTVSVAHNISATYLNSTPADVRMTAFTLQGDFGGILSSGIDSGSTSLSIGSLAFTAVDFGVEVAVSGATATSWTADGDWTERDDTADASSRHHVQTRNYGGSGTDTVTSTLVGGGNREASAAVVFSGTPSPPGTPTVNIDFANDGSFTAGDDVTADVLATPGVKLRRGYNISRAPMQPAVGSLSFNLGNSDGTYDDDGASGLGRNDPARVLMTFAGKTYALWRGRLRDVSQMPNSDQQHVAISAIDTLGSAPKRKGFSTALFSAITIDVAIGHVLDALGIAAGLRTLDTGTVTLEHFWLDSDDDPYRILTQLVNAEGPKARLYVDGAGKVVFEANDFRTTDARSTALQETFVGDGSEPLLSRVMSYADGVDRIVNKASIPWRTLALRTGQPEIVGSTENVVNTATTIAQGTIPSGVRTGDIVFYIIAANETTTNTWTVATDWTRFSGGLFSPGTTFSSDHAFKRITDSAEGGTKFSVTMNESQKYVAICVAVRGLKEIGALTTSGVIDVEAQANSSSTTSLAANVTTTVANTMLMTLAVVEGTTYTAPPTGATEVLQGAGDEVTAAISFEQLTATGVQANTYTFSGTHAAAILSQAWIYEDEATVWSFGESISLDNDEVRVITAEFDLAVSGAIAPVEDEDYVVSAGASLASLTLDRTSGSSITMTLTAAAAGEPHVIDPMVDIPDEDNIKGIRLRAIPLEETARGTAAADDSTSQTAFEERGLQSYPTFPYIAEDDAQTLADALIADWKDPRPLIVIRVHGDRDTVALTSALEREISDRVQVTTSRGGLSVLGWVERIDHQIGRRGLTVTDLAVRKLV